jgi:hypothetical protein
LLFPERALLIIQATISCWKCHFMWPCRRIGLISCGEMRPVDSGPFLKDSENGWRSDRSLWNAIKSPYRNTWWTKPMKNWQLSRILIKWHPVNSERT